MCAGGCLWFVVRCALPAACSSSVVGCSLCVVSLGVWSCCLLRVGLRCCSLFDVCCALCVVLVLVVCWLLDDARCSLFVARGSLRVVCCVLLVVRCSLLVCHLFCAACCLLSVLVFVCLWVFVVCGCLGFVCR